MADTHPAGPSGPGQPDNTKLAGTLGMALFIVVVSTLFAASIVGYLVVRLRNPEWEPPALPIWLYVSTFVIIGSSMTMQLALGSFRAGRIELARNSLAATLALALLYLVSQTLAWVTLVQGEVFAQSSLFAFTFYMLTVLHAVHVLGGIVPMASLTTAAYRGRYDAQSHMPVKYMTMYWHCLSVIWIVLFVVLVATT